MPSLKGSLSGLRSEFATVSAGNDFPEPGMASVTIDFANGTRLSANYWRVINHDGRISSFDHQQQYGLRAKIDAIDQLTKLLQGQIVTEALLDEESGDLLFCFGPDIKLQVFNFTGYEIWEIRFPDGTGEYSNYV